VKRGSLNVGMRVERGVALLASMYANTHTKKGGFTIFDFMSHDSEQAVTLEQAMETWG
jgi:hypothetical protein